MRDGGRAPARRYGLAVLDRLDGKQTVGAEALGVMEGHLRNRMILVGDHYPVADISLYACTHVAHEGGFDFDGFPAVRAWLDRVAAQPNHIAITQG